MTDAKKVSALPTGTNTTGTELIVGDQDGVTVTMTPVQLLTGRAGTGSDSGTSLAMTAGGADAGVGGSLTFTAGSTNGANPGDILLASGNAAATSTLGATIALVGGAIELFGGFGPGGGGLGIQIVAGNTGTSADADGTSVKGGSNTSTGKGGDLQLNGGLSVSGNGGHVLINGGSTGSGTIGQIKMTTLPTADPHVIGALWNSSGTLKISAG